MFSQRSYVFGEQRRDDTVDFCVPNNACITYAKKKMYSQAEKLPKLKKSLSHFGRRFLANRAVKLE
jgi:hypothetical protein